MINNKFRAFPSHVNNQVTQSIISFTVKMFLFLDTYLLFKTYSILSGLLYALNISNGNILSTLTLNSYADEVVICEYLNYILTPKNIVIVYNE